ncbi:MAG TPA: FAD-dependent oxidoreductase [Terriglobales bacterium]|nr:FAD-dependent oxidoreductase [Terriglobales bacterium]
MSSATPPPPLAVIGGGPAGALCAAELAAAGQAVVLLDEKLAWEKPCGGGITDKALRQFPFLRDAAFPHNPVAECELTSPAGRSVVLALDRSVAIFSRRTLNGLLLERARRAGAAIVHDRVVGLEADDRGWRLQLRQGAPQRARAVVVAAGARNPFRRLPAPLGPAEWMATAGYYLPLERLPWPAQRMAVRFLPALEGYIWSFPRGDHASVGICGALGTPPAAALRQRLEQALAQWGIAWGGAPFYAHLLPAPSRASLRRARFAGASPQPWALIGDAAGLVDPITGEGLFYALRSATLLAQAWAQAGDRPAPDAYLAGLRRELLPELEAAAALAPRFYHGRFLGAAVLERMVLFSQRSARFRQLLCDLFSGAQGYLGLRARLYRQLLPTLWQLAP